MYDISYRSRALCAGVLSCSLAMWPKTAMRRCQMTLLIAGRPVSADISEVRTNCLNEILRILRWHFIWNASRDLASAGESMSQRHRVGRTGREQGKHIFWWKGVAGVPSRYCPKTTLLRRPRWSACGRLVGSIHRMTRLSRYVKVETESTGFPSTRIDGGCGPEPTSSHRRLWPHRQTAGQHPSA